jgi:hypothetical protein
MNRLEHIVESLCLLASNRVAAAIARIAGDPFDPWADNHIWNAIDHAEAVAAIDARADEPPARWPFQHEPWLDQPYTRYYNALVEQQYWQQAYPDNPAGHTLYCPRGCNQLSTTAGYDECGACGSIMRPGRAAEENYYESLIAAGQCM